jgi:hypothetical protein
MTDSADKPTRSLPSRYSRRAIAIMAIVGLVFASPYLVVASLMAYEDVKEWSQRLPFDSTIWKASLAHDDGNTIRLRMIDDLMRRHTLKGISRKEAVELLGTPRPTSYFGDYPMVYWLGPERGFISIDSEWLAIRFDAQDRVSDADIVRD